MKKKLIAGLTSAAMLASLTAPAFAANFQDVKGTPSEKAAGLLKALGVVNGDVNGNFNPNATITRAEFAKIAVLLAGYKNAADAYGTNVTPFSTDVQAGHWAAGYIQVAKDTGLVNGYDQWNFGPSDNVKYEEVLAVALRILGYNDNLPGSWPSDYVIKGTQLKLNTNTQFAIGKAATRGDVALIAAAALGQATVAYSKDLDTFLTGPTLISSKFSNSVIQKQLKDSKTLAGTILTVDGQIKFGDNGTTAADTTATVNADTVVAGGSLESLVGKEVNIIKDSNDVVLYIGDATAASKVVTGALKGSVSGSTVTLSDGSTYTLATNAVVLLNGALPGVALDNTNTGKDDSVTLILNSAGQVEAVSVKHFSAPAIVTDLVAKTAVSAARVNALTLADNVVISLNGQAATFADLKKDDVIYYTVANGKVTQLDAFRNTVTGKLSGFVSNDNVNAASVTIDGTSYAVSSAFTMTKATATSFLNTSVLVLLDKDGKVASMKAAPTATATKFAVRIKDVKENVNIINSSTGEATVYTKITYVGNDNVEKTAFVALDSSGADVVDFTAQTVPLTYDAVDKVYSITFDSNGYINAGTTVAADVTNTIDTDGVNATNKSITVAGSIYYVNDATVIYDVTGKKFVGFDALKAGQGVVLTKDTTNGAVISTIQITSGGTVAALKNAPGVYVSSRSSAVYDAATSTTITKFYVTLNVAGVNTEFETESYLTATVGDLVFLADGDSDGKYDVVKDSTTGVVVSSTVYADATVANGFDLTSGGSENYVFDSTTKFVVVKFAGSGVGGAATATDWADPDQRDAAVTGVSADFTQLLGQTSSDDFEVALVPTTTKIAGYTLVDTVVVYLKK